MLDKNAYRSTKILATLGPSSDTEEGIRALVEAGANVFRLNFSHGTHEEHTQRMNSIRRIEEEIGSPIGVLADLQGPKLRVGQFKGGEKVQLDKGATFSLYLEDKLGDVHGAQLPHPEIFEVMQAGHELLLDDGKIRLKVKDVSDGIATTEVVVGGLLSDRKGVNVPDSQLPISAMTEKDRADLVHALAIGANWIALSFVQRPEDIIEARRLIGGKAGLLAKLEKPSALEHLDEIIDLSDAVMVARGDLGVELPPERVPSIQKQIVEVARSKGKPVVVATQMLESMISSPVATRAEASDVATAIYDGVDAVMLSAETAAGDYPLESVRVMRRIIDATEADSRYRKLLQVYPIDGKVTDSDAIASAACDVAEARGCACIVTFTSTGSTSIRAARLRAAVPILSLTPSLHVAQKLALVWGIYSVRTRDVQSFSEIVGKSVRTALRKGIATKGDRVVITAGVPFGVSGSTNVLRLSEVNDETLAH